MRIDADEEGVEGVGAHEAFEQFGAVLHRDLALADDGGIDERSARARLVGLPELLQLAGDGGDFDGRAEGGGGCAGCGVGEHSVDGIFSLFLVPVCEPNALSRNQPIPRSGEIPLLLTHAVEHTDASLI